MMRNHHSQICWGVVKKASHSIRYGTRFIEMNVDSYISIGFNVQKICFCQIEDEMVFVLACGKTVYVNRFFLNRSL